MEAGNIIRVAMAVTGITVMLCSFWFLVVKRMTADFAVVWEIIGGVLIIIGGVWRISAWTADFHDREEISAVCIGIAVIFSFYLLSLSISRIMMRNHELAIEVSMLLREKSVNQASTEKAGQQNQRPEKDLLVIMPVKNEEKNIEKVLEQLFQPEIRKIADILCINDASSDTSGQIIDRYPCVQITNVFGLGYGSALQLGYKYAVRENYEYVIQLDADGQHDARNIPLIYEKLQEEGADGKTPDIVLASRFMEGSSEFRVSVVKRFAFWLFRSMIQTATGRKIADPTTGLQGLSRAAFTYYSGFNNFDYQYPDANMVMQMLLLQFRVAEIPAVMYARTDGKSMHSGLEPVGYMMRMFLSVLAVVFRSKILKSNHRVTEG